MFRFPTAKEDLKRRIEKAVTQQLEKTASERLPPATSATSSWRERALFYLLRRQFTGKSTWGLSYLVFLGRWTARHFPGVSQWIRAHS